MLRAFGVPLPPAAGDVSWTKVTGWSGRDLYLRFSLTKAGAAGFLSRFDPQRLRLRAGYVPFTRDDEKAGGWRAIPQAPGLRGGSVSARSETSPAIDLCVQPTGEGELVYVMSGLA